MEKLYLMPGTSNNGGEHSTWSIISCKASFAHTRSIIDNEGGNFVFHFLEKEGLKGGRMFKTDESLTATHYIGVHALR